VAEVHLYIRTQVTTDQATAEALAAQACDLKAACVAAGAEPSSVHVAVVPDVPQEADPAAADAPPVPVDASGDAGEGDSDVW
jgi:hypothetical protein